MHDPAPSADMKATSRWACTTTGRQGRTAERLEDDTARRRRLKREGELVVDANSDGASEGGARSVSRRGPGSQLFDSGDNTGHRVVEVLVACRLQDALFHVLAERP